MGDFIQFNEGSDYINDHGWPGTVWFLLSSAAIGTLTVQSTLATGLSEITGTGYTRMSQALPTSVDGAFIFNAMSWTTDVAADWSPQVYSIIAATTGNNTGVALCGWNLQVNGVPRNLSRPFTTEEVVPIYVS